MEISELTLKLIIILIPGALGTMIMSKLIIKKDLSPFNFIVNCYERNQKARQECIKHHGDKCFACGFDFGITYGDIAKGFIHVHHLTQLADINEEYDVDPINDLVPICANCHSVIHLTKPAMTIEELKRQLKKVSR